MINLVKLAKGFKDQIWVLGVNCVFADVFKFWDKVLVALDNAVKQLQAKHWDRVLALFQDI